MKIENKHAKKFSQFSTDLYDLNRYGVGTGEVSAKQDAVSKADSGGIMVS